MTVSEIQLQDNTDKIIALGARENDYVLEFVDWGTAKIKVATIYYFPTDTSERILNTEWEPRPINITGWVIGKDGIDIETKSQALEEFIVVQSEMKILYGGYHLVFYPTKDIKFANTEVDNNEVLRKFQIEGVCVDPLWKNDTTLEYLDSHTEPLFMFPLIIDQESGIIFGEVYGENSVVIKNDGQTSGVIITLSSAGSFSDLSIYLRFGTETQRFLLEGTFSANAEIVIDTREGFQTVTVDGVDITGQVESESHWLRLRNGMNMFAFVYDGSEQLDIDITIKQYDLFEVQI